MDCLKDIIGISRTECECIDVDAEYQNSTSGIYIDEVEGGLTPTAIEKIDCQTFVEKMVQARKRAVDMFVESILAEYSTESFRKALRDFKGTIGKLSHVRDLNTSKYAGMVLKTKWLKGAAITVKSVGLIINQESDVVVQVYKGYRDSQDLELVTEINYIPTIKNVASKFDLPEPLILPMHDDAEQAIDYYFVYDTELYGKPRDNEASCNCGGAYSVLKKYTHVGGVTHGSIESITKSKVTSKANGFYIEAEIKCYSKEVICELLKLDESNTIAHAIAYKSQELLIEDLMSTGRINRFTQLSKEHLWGKRNHFRKEFDDRVVWLSQTYSMNTLSDCVICTDNRMTRMLIR